eukprot:Filipodium_phascolosomae@DN8809_c0_g1_i1.p1
MYERAEPFILKELERIAASRGIVVQAVKEVVQSLVDDSLVRVDKVGSQNVYWALPSEAFVIRENKIRQINEEIQNLHHLIKENERRVAVLKEERGDNNIRLVIKAETATLEKEIGQLRLQIEALQKKDPKLKKEAQLFRNICRDGSHRWDDNVAILHQHLISLRGVDDRYLSPLLAELNDKLT